MIVASRPYSRSDAPPAARGAGAPAGAAPPQRRPRFPVGILQLAGLLGALGLIAGLAFYVSLPAAAIVYAAGYMLLTWVRPELALMLMFAAAPFPYDLGGGPVKMALAEINLVLATPVLLIRTLQRHRHFARNPIKWPVLAYFGVCVIASLHAGITADTVKSMLQMGIYMVLAVFVFSSCVHELKLFYAALYGLLLSAAFLGALGIITRHEFLLGIHKNAVGTTLSYAVIICGELWFAEPDRRRRRWLGLLGCLLVGGLFFSLSRGAWVGAAAGLGIVAAMRKQFKLLFRGMLVSACIIGAFWQLLPKSEQQYATDLSASAHNVKARLISIQYAMHYFETSPIIGSGVGLRKEYDATNVVVSTLAETGALGLVTFLAIFVALTWSLWRARRGLPTADPLFSLLAIGLALAACQFMHGLVDHYWSRDLVPPWACAGMAFFACQTIRNRKQGAGR